MAPVAGDCNAALADLERPRATKYCDRRAIEHYFGFEQPPPKALRQYLHTLDDVPSDCCGVVVFLLLRNPPALINHLHLVRATTPVEGIMGRLNLA